MQSAPLSLAGLRDFSLRCLATMVDEQTGLYVFRRVRRPDGGVVSEGTSVRYTAITIAGLHRARRAGMPVPSDLFAPWPALMQRVEEMPDVGDLGLALWADAIGDCSHLDRLHTRIREVAASSPHVTMHWAWLLTGLIYAKPHLGEAVDALVDRAWTIVRDAFEGAGGLFRYADSKPLSFFAEQVYGTYAAAAYAGMSGDTRALRIAEQCAATICRHQGDLGQWLWRYDARTGRVLDPYPVYSVHQDGMGPMALLKLKQVGGTDYTTRLMKGLGWIYGANELNLNLVDEKELVIWRSIRPRGALKSFKRINLALGALKMGGTDWPYRAVGAFEVDAESRPYHLGWLLYAFADVSIPDAPRRLSDSGSL